MCRQTKVWNLNDLLTEKHVHRVSVHGHDNDLAECRNIFGIKPPNSCTVYYKIFHINVDRRHLSHVSCKKATKVECS